jgi:hypothetical protein
MPEHHLPLILLSNTFAVCRLPADAPLPEWVVGAFVSVTRTVSELSVVCREDAVPAGVQREGGWWCLRVAGTLDFGLVGVLASLLVPLADAGVSVLCVSTFDTDYLLVKEADLARGIAALQAAGHSIQAAG